MAKNTKNNELDNLSYIKKIDKQGMAGLIKEILQQIEIASNLVKKIKLPSSWQKGIKQIVFCGMGGSGISGSIIANLLKNKIKIPFFVIRDYRLPGFINSQTLVLLVSYSGQTQETISCFFQAQKKKAKIIIISKNGQLLKLAQKNKIIFHKINYEAAPRAAIIHLLIPSLIILEKLKIIKKEINYKRLAAELKIFNQKLLPENPENKNLAKQIARQCSKKIPLIIAGEFLTAVARRWKNQFNENGKNLAFFENLPELNHNLIEGLKFPLNNKSLLYFILLESRSYSPAVKKNFEFLKKIFREREFLFKTIIGLIVGTEHCSVLTEALSLILLGDWVSFYLAILNKTDPTPVKEIDKRKKYLAK